jgi:hypothetical protein
LKDIYFTFQEEGRAGIITVMLQYGLSVRAAVALYKEFVGV